MRCASRCASSGGAPTARQSAAASALLAGSSTAGAASDEDACKPASLTGAGSSVSSCSRGPAGVLLLAALSTGVDAGFSVLGAVAAGAELACATVARRGGAAGFGTAGRRGAAAAVAASSASRWATRGLLLLRLRLTELGTEASLPAPEDLNPSSLELPGDVDAVNGRCNGSARGPDDVTPGTAMSEGTSARSVKRRVDLVVQPALTPTVTTGSSTATVERTRMRGAVAFDPVSRDTVTRLSSTRVSP